MIDARRHDHQVILFELDPNPIVPFASNIEKATSIKDISDFLVFVQVLVEEGLDLVFIDSSHSGRRDGDLIAVLVVPLGSQGVHILEVGIVEM